MEENSIDKYLRTGSIEQSAWCSVVLFGKNTASYKLAPRSSSCSLCSRGATPSRSKSSPSRSRHASANTPRRRRASQSTARTNFSTHVRACNAGTIALEELTSATVQSSFRYVLDAFRVVNASQVTMTFFEKDFTRGSNVLPGIGLMPRAGDENLRERVPDGQKRREFSLERRIGAHTFLSSTLLLGFETQDI